MDSSVSPKDEMWFLRVYHHISTGLYIRGLFVATGVLHVTRHADGSMLQPGWGVEVWVIYMWRTLYIYKKACPTHRVKYYWFNVVVSMCNLKGTIYRCVSEQPGRGPVPGPGINYTEPREVLLEFVILVF